MPIFHFYGDEELPISGPIIIEAGHGDLGMSVMSHDESCFFGITQLDKAIGVGSTPTEGYEKSLPQIVMSFPLNSPDALDVIIGGLQNFRDKYYKDAPIKFTKEMNPIR